MPSVITLDGRRPPISFLGQLKGAAFGNPVGDWIMNRSLPVAIGSTILLSALVGVAVGYSASWTYSKVTGR